jgi:acetolactate synthase small subunit
VNEPKAKILRALIDEHPTAMARVAIAQAAEVSETSSGFEKNLSQLKTLGAIEYPMSGVVALTRFVMP